MGLFEQQPWLLVPLILVVVAAYDLGKQILRQTIFRGDRIPDKRR